MLAYAGDVTWRRRFERGKARLCENGERAAAIGGARLTRDPAALFEASDCLREAGLGVAQHACEVAHTHGPSRLLGQADQDGVVRVGHAGSLLKLAVELLHEQLRGRKEGAPGAL